MKGMTLILMLFGFFFGGCAKAVDRCPSNRPELISSLKRDGFTGAIDADIKLIGNRSGYCFFRYEYVFGQSGRMSSRLVVFSHGRYIGSYAFSFSSLKIEQDRIVVALPSGDKQSILFQEMGSKLLIDGEPLVFYK
jgi:hypothetical protein